MNDGRETLRLLAAMLLGACATIASMAQTAVEIVAPPSAVADSLIALFDNRTLDPIEGLWQWPDDGATIAVTRQSDTTFCFVVVDAPDTSLKPGTVIGTAKITAKPGTYDASLMSRTNKLGIPSKPKKSVITVGNRGTMAMNEYSTGYRISFRRLIPYLFRLTLVKGGNKPANIDGPVRIYPVESPMASPILL